MSSLQKNISPDEATIMAQKIVELNGYFEKQKLSSIRSLILFIGATLLILLGLKLSHLKVVYASFLVTGMFGLFTAVFFCIRALYFGYKVHRWKP
ncbi:hypothetical protein KKB41_02630 [Patescibacteria group bacterium]|nr:hypothetical protein [Patescibacteria group bacterium]